MTEHAVLQEPHISATSYTPSTGPERGLDNINHIRLLTEHTISCCSCNHSDVSEPLDMCCVQLTKTHPKFAHYNPKPIPTPRCVNNHTLLFLSATFIQVINYEGMLLWENNQQRGVMQEITKVWLGNHKGDFPIITTTTCPKMFLCLKVTYLLKEQNNTFSIYS